jgi:rod shape-determining protein MreC
MRRILELLDRHTAGVSLVAAVVLSGALMSLGEAEQSKVRAAVQVALWPSQRAVSLVEGYSSLWGENRRLRRLAAESTLDGDRLRELEAENRRLRNLLGFSERGDMKLIPAQVVRRDAGPLAGAILVDRGRNHGVSERMTVIGAEGLVGSVAAAGAERSEIELLTAKDFAVSSRVEGSDVHGIVKWHPAARRLRMHNVPVQVEVAPGDVVLTSSLGGKFVDGVRIGRVEEVGEDEDGLFKRIDLETPAYLWSLREVFIVPEVISSPLDSALSRAGPDLLEAVP